MPDTEDERERFRQRYSVSGADPMLGAEFEALGSDYRANGYTTRRQAEQLGRELDLAPGRLLLDIGAGCGWPGLYLAGVHGCEVISLDPVSEGMEVALARGCADGLGRRSRAVQADAVALPLRAASVDAIVHTDLLC